MSKSVLLLSFISLAFLLVGAIIMPNSPALWLASSALGYDIVRIVLMLILFGLLITNPPRNHVFRALVGFIAVGLTVWSLAATYDNRMQILDSASILAASVSMGITALEFQYDDIDNIDIELLRLQKQRPLIQR
jgi:hypothetical protein